MHVCLLLVQNSAAFPLPSKSSLINSLKHLTSHRSSRHTSTCPSANSVWESSLLQMGQMADTRGCSVNFGKICCSAAHGTALLTKPRIQTVSGKLCMVQARPLFGQHLAPPHLLRLLSFGFRNLCSSGSNSTCPSHPLELVISLTAQSSTKDLFRSARNTAETAVTG